MKLKITSIILVVVQSLQFYAVSGQATTDNFSLQVIPYNSVSTSIADLSNVINDPDKVRKSIVYYDGFGRILESINWRYSPQKRDIIQFVEYNKLGLQSTEYLAYSSSRSSGYGSFVDLSAAKIEQSSFYLNEPNIEHSAFPHAEKRFTYSPLSRVEEVGAVGEVWQLSKGHSNKSNSRLNVANEIPKWAYKPGGSNVIEMNGYWDPNTVWVTEFEDADGNKGLTYTNVQGNIIGSRTLIEHVSGVDVFKYTYNVYDDLDQLVCVITPKAFEGIKNMTTPGFSFSSNVFNENIYFYIYDNLGRLVEKKIPGAGWEYYIYDVRGNLVLSQNANQRILKKWIFTKYDALGRELFTGVFNQTAYESTVAHAPFDRSSLQDYVLASYTSNWEIEATKPSITPYPDGYSNYAFPHTAIESILSVTYYDNYDLDYDASLTNDQNYSNPGGIYSNNKPSLRVIGFNTANISSVIKTSVSNTLDQVATFNFYNTNGQQIQNQTLDQYGKDQIGNVVYDLEGKVTNSFTKFKYYGVLPFPGDKEIPTNERYEYDHQGRLLKHFIARGSKPETEVANYSYNEEDQLIRKGLNHNTGANINLQDVNYCYNIRGWLKQINSPDLQSCSGSIYRDDIEKATEALRKAILEHYWKSLLQQNSNNPTVTIVYVNSGNPNDPNNVLHKATVATSGTGFDGIIAEVPGLYSFKSISFDNGTSTFIVPIGLMSFIGQLDLFSNTTYGYESPLNSSTIDQLLTTLLNGLGAQGFPPSELNSLKNDLLGIINGYTNCVNCNNPSGGNTDLYGSRIYYDEQINKSISGAININPSKFNGTVSGVTWKMSHPNNANPDIHALGFQYDGVHQLKSTTYGASAARTTFSKNAGMYNEVFSYDINGNISNIQRNSNIGLIDNIAITYNENKLRSTKDITGNYIGYGDGVVKTDEFEYDANGNIIYDENTNISITYNILNLPEKIRFHNGYKGIVDKAIYYTYVGANRIETITEVYTSSPIVKKIHSYNSGGEVENNVFLFSQFTEGRIQDYFDPFTQTSDFVYEYFLTDHLGNIRAIFRDNPITPAFDLEVLQLTNYYAFGAEWTNSAENYINSTAWSSGLVNKYLFNGAEKQSDFNFDWYNYGFRMMNPWLGRWNAPDPLSEDDFTFSPYGFVGNNPINTIDEMGLSGTDFIKRADGSVVWDPAVTSPSLMSQYGYGGGDTYEGVRFRDDDGMNYFMGADGPKASKEEWMYDGSISRVLHNVPIVSRVNPAQKGSISANINSAIGYEPPPQWGKSGTLDPVTINGIAKKHTDFGPGALNGLEASILADYVHNSISTSTALDVSKQDLDFAKGYFQREGNCSGEWGVNLKYSWLYARDYASWFVGGQVAKGAYKIYKEIKILKAAKGGQTVIGEGMKRVSMEAAKREGSVILNNMPKFTGTADQVTSQMMTYNRQWILQQMRSGRPILDIGLDATRANPSIFYQMEQNMMRNYLKLHPNAFQVIKP